MGRFLCPGNRGETKEEDAQDKTAEDSRGTASVVLVKILHLESPRPNCSFLEIDTLHGPVGAPCLVKQAYFRVAMCEADRITSRRIAC